MVAFEKCKRFNFFYVGDHPHAATCHSIDENNRQDESHANSTLLVDFMVAKDSKTDGRFDEDNNHSHDAQFVLRSFQFVVSGCTGDDCSVDHDLMIVAVVDLNAVELI